MVIDTADYRRSTGETAEFKDYIRSDPAFDDLDLARSAERPRDIGEEWGRQSG